MNILDYKLDTILSLILEKSMDKNKPETKQLPAAIPVAPPVTDTDYRFFTTVCYLCETENDTGFVPVRIKGRIVMFVSSCSKCMPDVLKSKIYINLEPQDA